VLRNVWTIIIVLTFGGENWGFIAENLEKIVKFQALIGNFFSTVVP
jgi:hypothetical protein